MKIIFSICLTIILILLSGCSGDNEISKNNDDSIKTSPTYTTDNKDNSALAPSTSTEESENLALPKISNIDLTSENKVISRDDMVLNLSKNSIKGKLSVELKNSAPEDQKNLKIDSSAKSQILKTGELIISRDDMITRDDAKKEDFGLEFNGNISLAIPASAIPASAIPASGIEGMLKFQVEATDNKILALVALYDGSDSSEIGTPFKVPVKYEKSWAEGTDSLVLTLTPELMGSSEIKILPASLKIIFLFILKPLEETVSVNGHEFDALPAKADGTYNLNKAGLPFASIKTGEADGSIKVLLTTESEGAVIYYTKNGALPIEVVNDTNFRYNGADIVLAKGETLKAIAFKENFVKSEVYLLINGN